MTISETHNLRKEVYFGTQFQKPLDIGDMVQGPGGGKLLIV